MIEMDGIWIGVDLNLSIPAGPAYFVRKNPLLVANRGVVGYAARMR